MFCDYTFLIEFSHVGFLMIYIKWRVFVACLALLLLNHLYVFSSERLSISLPCVIEKVLKNQWDILISSENIDRQRGIVQSTAGPFNVRVDGDATQAILHNPQLNGYKPGKDGNVSTFNVALAKKTRMGTELALGSQAFWTHNPVLLLANVIPTTNLSTIDMFFIVDQPLLRGLIDNQDFINEQIAHVELEAVTYDFIQTISNQMRDTIRIYWDLVAQQKAIEIRKKSQSRIKELIDDTKKLIDAGEVALTETFQQYAELAQEETQEQVIQTQLNSTFQLLLYQMGIQISNQEKIPENLELDPFPAILSADKILPLFQLMQIAWGNRADLKSAELRTEEAFLLLKGANNEVLPHLNLRGRVDYKNSKIGPTADTPFSALASKTPEVDLAITLDFSYPLCNDAALGRQHAISAETRQAQLAQSKLMEQIRTNLTAAFQNNLTLLRELSAANKSVEWYEENLNSEIKRLKEGYSTIFIVIDFQRRLNDALTRQVDAQRQYVQNFVDLLYVTGTLISYDDEQNIACIADLKGINLISEMKNE